MQDTLPEGALHVCHALRQSARMPATALSAAAASPNASWSFSLGPFIVLAGLTFVYVRRLARVRRVRRTPRAVPRRASPSR